VLPVPAVSSGLARSFSSSKSPPLLLVGAAAFARDELLKLTLAVCG